MGVGDIKAINTGDFLKNANSISRNQGKLSIEEFETSEYKSNAIYTGEIDLWREKCSEEAIRENGKVTTDNKTYEVFGDVTDMENGIISESDYMYLLATVAYESSSDYDGMLGVATTMLNRLESSDHDFANQKSIEDVLRVGYWPWGKTCNYYLNYENGKPVLKTKQEIDASNNADYAKLEMAKEVVNDALNGYRNLTKSTYYYGGGSVINGVLKNRFRDNL